MDLFEYHAKEKTDAARPLAERMRPRTLDAFVGQTHLTGEGGVIRHVIESGRIFSMILWGPPGCGKTTLARITAEACDAHFVHFSAVLSGVKEIKAVIEAAKDLRNLHHRRTVLFVDEIHRFNKAQQDAFLHHVESGLITLVGATTENPSFEVIPPLLSRCRVITLKALENGDIAAILKRATAKLEKDTGGKPVSISSEAFEFLVDIADGDARTALNGLELAASLAGKGDAVSLNRLERALQKKSLLYDKTGEGHYNLISALHKSLRGSDPDAALYWLCRMLTAGEDPLFIARRMVRFASEDIGNADPQALAVAMHAMESFKFLGHPEGELALAQAAAYLATAPKSNRIYTAWQKVQETVKRTGSLPVPLHIRNAPTRLMKDMGYGKGYQYPHDRRHAVVAQTYLPERLVDVDFYRPTERGYEKIIKNRMEKWNEYRRGQNGNGMGHEADGGGRKTEEAQKIRSAEGKKSRR